ncbi:hypothetical protein CHS0354_013242, partial [Potamilus streckersoni]
MEPRIQGRSLGPTTPQKSYINIAYEKNTLSLPYFAEVGLGYKPTTTAMPWLGWAAFVVLPSPGAGVGAFCLVRSRALKCQRSRL